MSQSEPKPKPRRRDAAAGHVLSERLTHRVPVARVARAHDTHTGPRSPARGTAPSERGPVLRQRPVASPGSAESDTEPCLSRRVCVCTLCWACRWCEDTTQRTQNTMKDPHHSTAAPPKIKMILFTRRLSGCYARARRCRSPILGAPRARAVVDVYTDLGCVMGEAAAVQRSYASSLLP